jgi:hypothetical protein
MVRASSMKTIFFSRGKPLLNLIIFEFPFAAAKYAHNKSTSM